MMPITIKGPIKISENGRISKELEKYHPIKSDYSSQRSAVKVKKKAAKKESFVEKFKSVLKRPRKGGKGGKHGRSN